MKNNNNNNKFYVKVPYTEVTAPWDREEELFFIYVKHPSGFINTSKSRYSDKQLEDDWVVDQLRKVDDYKFTLEELKKYFGYPSPTRDFLEVGKTK